MLMGTTPSGTQTRYNLVRLSTGMVFGATVVACLLSIVAWYPTAFFDMFAVHAVVAFLAALVVFSRVDLVATVGRGEAFLGLSTRWLVVFFVVLVGAYFSKTAESLSRVVMITWLVLTPWALGAVMVVLRWLIRHYYAKEGRRRKAVFVRLSPASARLAQRLQSSVLNGIEVLGYFDDGEIQDPAGPVLSRLGALADAPEFVAHQGVDMVYIAMDAADNATTRALMEALQDSTISIYFVPGMDLFGAPGIQVSEMEGVPLLVAAETPFVGVARILKRLMDVGLASFFLVVLSPVLLAVALAVKLSSPGPVLFRQKRYGVGGREIDIYKFRSMVTQAPGAPVVQATQHDARVTRVGRILRRTSLDELPQFINVLQGSMSIVGPRPHAVEHNELYRRRIPGYMLRHKVKPGIIGLAQVNGLRGETESLDKMERRIAMDLEYIRHWSIALDIRIILRTALVVIYDKNAY